jgi:2-polyprenyl-6-methoxyphenol hydroxylase-like FAD-dependent oxidoreductase
MRILIVGAGVAGLSLASLLIKRGITPTIIEKSASLSEVGYMLGLFPVGANVLRSLDVYDAYLENSISGAKYEAYDADAHLLKSFSFAPIVERYGPYQLISRSDLLALLKTDIPEENIRFKTYVEKLNQTADKVSIVFNDQREELFDLVVAADGLHSHTRSLLLDKNEYQYFNTGWGGWVWWANSNLEMEHTIKEYWGIGSFLGLYPVKNKIGVIAAVNSSTAEQALKGSSRTAFLHQKFSSLLTHSPQLFAELPGDNEPIFFWSLKDQRAQRWANGRVVLLGDSAAAFLPTAGVGATMALESSAVLNDILSRTGIKYIPQALQQFEKRSKERVEGAQNDSRRLAKMMFVSSAWASWIRNYWTKKMSVESLIKSIVKGFDEPI